MSHDRTLSEAIQTLVALGEVDPLTIARKIMAREEREWLASELLSLAEDLLAEMARQRLGSVRRSAELALRPGDQVAAAELKITKYWVSAAVGWKRADQLTAADLREKARWYDALAGSAARRAAWCREVAGLIEAEAAECLGKLKAPLPPLPASDAALELGEAA